MDGDQWGSDDPPEPLDDQGDEPEDDEPRPALPEVPGSKPAPPPAELVALGPPPEDPMAAAAWAYRLLMVQAHQTMLDPKLSQADRRKEVRIILSGATKHMNDAIRYEVATLIKRDRAELEARKRGHAAAKLERRGKLGAGAKIIPIRRDG